MKHHRIGLPVISGPDLLKHKVMGFLRSLKNASSGSEFLSDTLGQICGCNVAITYYVSLNNCRGLLLIYYFALLTYICKFADNDLKILILFSADLAECDCDK
jgi:hypothetical protein